VVDQYVSYLRRKIDKPFGVSQLETLRGVGYRLRHEPGPALADGFSDSAEINPTVI
jgi:two-component system OmpR family response regulator